MRSTLSRRHLQEWSGLAYSYKNEVKHKKVLLFWATNVFYKKQPIAELN
jgi:hypothetical protein